MKIITSISEIESIIYLPENQDLESRLKYISLSLYQYTQNICIVIESKIIGWLAYNPNYEHDENENTMNLEFITVDEKYQGNGCASLLLDHFIHIAQDSNQGVSVGRLTYDGRCKIKPKITSICIQYNIPLLFNHYRDRD